MKTVCIENAAEIITESAAKLKDRIDSHNKLIAAAFGTEEIDDSTGSSDSQLRQALIETIEVLEETRKAFKSKKLEALRKKLMQVLMED